MKPRQQPDERSFDEFLQSWLLYMGTVGLFVFVIWCATRVASDGTTQLTIVWGFLAVVAIGAVLVHYRRWRKQRLLAGGGPSPADLPEVFGGGDGLSLETAVVIHLNNSLSGVGAEYYFISSQCGEQGKDWVPGSQRVQQHNGRLYDVMTVTLNNGEERTYHFDITNFYGK